MATIDIHNLSGEKVGTLDLAEEVFGAINEDLLWEAVKHYRAAHRAGTHATKNKKLVSGAGKKLLGALRSALASKLAEGKLIVVNAFDVKEPKSKLFRQALSALKVESTALLVETGRDSNRNLILSSRNLDGVELVNSSAVHPYHLLRYDRAIFSQPAIEALQVSLKNSVSKRQRKAVEKESTKKATRAPRRRVRHEKAAEVA